MMRLIILLQNIQRKNQERIIKEKNYQMQLIIVFLLLASTKNCSEIARILNNNGFRTSKDMLFSSKQVKRIIERYNLN